MAQKSNVSSRITARLLRYILLGLMTGPKGSESARLQEAARRQRRTLVPAGFDSSLANSPTRTLPVARVIDPLPRSHVPERVEEYRRAMLQGDLFPPVSVIRFAGKFFLADGHKRFAAYRMFAPRHVTVEVWTHRRWVCDQAGQLVRNFRKNGAILRLAFTNRREAARLLIATVGHWRRVALCLLAATRGPAA